VPATPSTPRACGNTYTVSSSYVTAVLLLPACPAWCLVNGAAHTSAAPSALPLHDGRTPLHLAAQSGRLEVVRELLRAGAALDAADEVRPPPHHGWRVAVGAIASQGGAGHWRVRLLDDRTTCRVDATAAAAAAAAAAEVSSTTNQLHKMHHLDARVILTSHLAGLLLQNGNTALHSAAETGRLEVVRQLLGAGAAVDAAAEVRQQPHMVDASNEQRRRLAAACA
jgi:hypothetical protein